MATIPFASWTPALDPSVQWVIGQAELGHGTGYRHWQCLFLFKSKKSLSAVRRILGGCGHYELTRSAAAEDYVRKEDTRIDGTPFELGRKPMRRAVSKDWDAVWANAVAGRLSDIPADIRVNSYRTLRAIATDHLVAPPIEKICKVFWGVTGSGKSRDAWGEAGIDAYPKDPRSKFWCGYRGQKHVIIGNHLINIDEFRGGIDVSHLLRWLDRYPVLVEIKGGAVALSASNVWITSNLSPNEWYPDLDAETLGALRRRLIIVHYQ